jgi:glycosyltransferase involved in cell wall biosynthesis
MKILQINNFHYRKGGAEAVYLNTIDLLNRKGHQVIPFSLKTGAEQVENFIDPEKMFHNKFYSFESARVIEQVIKKEKPNLAHIHNIIGGISYSILPVLKKYKIPVVSSIHGFRNICPVWAFQDKEGHACEKCSVNKYYYCTLKNCSSQGILRSVSITAESYMRDILFPFKKYFDKYLFVSHFTMNKFLESHPDVKGKSEVLYNFTPNSEQTNKPGVYYLYFGRLGREKGLITLFNAFNNNQDAKLVVVGDGELNETLSEMKSSNIMMVGYKEGKELESLIKNSSFVIISSECLENNPMAIVEAFSFGKPVIGSRIGGIPELIVEGETGFCFSPGNADQLAEVIKNSSIISEKKYYDMSEASFLFAKKNFSPDSYYNKLIEIYNEVLN